MNHDQALLVTIFVAVMVVYMLLDMMTATALWVYLPFLALILWMLRDKPR